MSVATSIVSVPLGAADDVVVLVVDDVTLLVGVVVEVVEVVVGVVVVPGGVSATYAPTPMITMIITTITIPIVREIPFLNDIEGAKSPSRYLRLFREFHSLVCPI